MSDHLRPDGGPCRNPLGHLAGSRCCGWVQCTGVHANARYSEMCAAAHSKKRHRDALYSATAKGVLKQVRSNAERRGNR